jgi:hypothetical protein
MCPVVDAVARASSGSLSVRDAGSATLIGNNSPPCRLHPCKDFLPLFLIKLKVFLIIKINQLSKNRYLALNGKGRTPLCALDSDNPGRKDVVAEASL